LRTRRIGDRRRIGYRPGQRDPAGPGLSHITGAEIWIDGGQSLLIG
jgi:hypothetical protein